MIKETKQEKWTAADLFERGCSLFRSGQYKDAASYFRLLTLMSPANGAYYAALGHALKKLGDLEGALPPYHTAVMLGGKDQPDLMFSLAETLKGLDLKVAALKALKQAILHADPAFKARLKLIQKNWRQS